MRLWGRRQEDHSTGDAAWRAQNLAGGGEPGGGRPHIFSPRPLLLLLPLHRYQGQAGPRYSAEGLPPQLEGQGQYQGANEAPQGQKARVTLAS